MSEFFNCQDNMGFNRKINVFINFRDLFFRIALKAFLLIYVPECYSNVHKFCLLKGKKWSIKKKSSSQFLIRA